MNERGLRSVLFLCEGVMKRLGISFACCAFLQPYSMGFAQSGQIPEDTLTALKQQLQSKTLVLRTYAASSWATYRVNGNDFQPQEHFGNNLSTFSVTGINQNGSTLELVGTRKSYVRLDGTRTLSGYPITTPMWLEIDLQGVTDIPALLQRLPSQLFFFSLQDAYASIPASILSCVVPEYSTSRKEIILIPACRKLPVDGVVPPEIRKPYQPQLPGWILKGENYVLLHLVVQTDGSPTEVKVLKTTSADMAAQAVAAMKQSKYDPATRDGVGVSSPAVMFFHFSR